MCWRKNRSLSALTAVVSAYSIVPAVIDSTGSIGNYVRALIRRIGTTIETTPGVTNTGNTMIPYTSTLQNGDEICVETSHTNFNNPIDTDCKIIPTPLFGFEFNP